MYPFIAAKWFTPTRGRVVDLIVLHSMEAPEKGDTAENVARFFSRLPAPPPDLRASAHYCVDDNSIVQCVNDKDVAYAAPGTNHNGIHIELAGYARQSQAEWDDPFSRAMLMRAAPLVAQKCKENGLPFLYRNSNDLRAGGERGRGITTHNEVRIAFGKTTHTDPGKGFPIHQFIDLVCKASGQSTMEQAMAGFPKAVDACLIPGFRAPDGTPGVWVVGSDGGVGTYPEQVGAPFHGSMGGKPLNAPMCAIVSPGTSLGYYLVAEDGGVFAFGDVRPVRPYVKLQTEWRNGDRKVVGAEWVGTGLVMLTSDGRPYHLETR